MLNPFNDPFGFEDSWLPYQIAFVIGLLVCIRTYMRGPECLSRERVDGKTIIITGSSGGIGKETALDLVKRGGRVIMACRDLPKAVDVAKEIMEKVPKNNGIVVMQLDLSSYKSVREFAKAYLEKDEKLDILINNAAVMLCPFSLTEDGYEQHLQVNYLGHFLLIHLLLEKLKSAPCARIINVSALAHRAVSLDLEDMNSEKNYVSRVAYAKSKLAQILMTRELCKRLQGSKVTVNSIHPGIIHSTDLLRHTPIQTMPILRFFLYPLAWLLLKTPKDGAQTTIFLAVASELETTTGQYYSDCQIAKISKDATDDELASKLWDISEEFTGIKKS